MDTGQPTAPRYTRTDDDIRTECARERAEWDRKARNVMGLLAGCALFWLALVLWAVWP